MDKTELELFKEMVVNEIEYINEEFMAYESARAKCIPLEPNHHLEINRLKGNFYKLEGMQRNLSDILTKLNKNKMQQEMK